MKQCRTVCSVLLSALLCFCCPVPIIPDWVRGEALALWATHDAPLAALLNTTVRRIAADEPGLILFYLFFFYLGKLNAYKTFKAIFIYL